MNYLARIYVTPKPGVVDPQGLSILGGLKSLGYDSVSAVRAGRYLEVHLGEAASSRGRGNTRNGNVPPAAGESGY